MNKGKVYLIGAGPGDPELLTLKGKRCLGEADVIVGDYLADKRILKFAKPDAEYIYVGKKVGCHTMKQHEISELLALNHGQVFSKEKIFESVFGYERESDSSAITEHVKNIRAKFARYGKKNIQTVWGIGYKWE